MITMPKTRQEKMKRQYGRFWFRQHQSKLEEFYQEFFLDTKSLLEIVALQKEYISTLENEIKILRKQNTDLKWAHYPDRMGR